MESALHEQHYVPAVPELSRAVGELLTSIADAAERALGAELVAVLLGGSLSRGQGVARIDGVPRLLSDLDLYIVTRDGSDSDAIAQLRADIRELCRSAMPELGVDVAMLGPDYFAGRVGALAEHRLARSHRVLRGDASEIDGMLSVLGSAPANFEEGQILLGNRIAELLLAETHNPDSQSARYAEWKLAADVVLAWMVRNGQPVVDSQGALRWLVEQLRTRETSDAAARLIAFADAVRERLATAIASGLRREQLAAMSREQLVRWTWPFVRATFEHDEGGSDALGRLLRHVERGAPNADDHSLIRGWLRRQGPATRARRARQWAGLAPAGLRHWLLYCGHGVGPELVYAACLAHYGGLEDPNRYLRPILSTNHAGRGEATSARVTVELWSSWIRGAKS